MTSSQSKITRQHLDRIAIVYVRQSSLAQVRGNQESTARQYGLTEEARRLGWDPERILVIDADLGISGRSATGRLGFQDLVHRVCLGEAGAVFGLEISRLARSSADLQRLLEFCSLTGTLVVDADGVYDLQSFNDRLLLGLKGTMSEAELYILAGRLQESKRAAARRGDLRFRLPVGYVHDDDGRTVMDPSDEVRSAVAGVFAAFDVAGSAYGAVGLFNGRPFPHRVYGGALGGDIRWGPLTHARAVQILSNPAYAGVYVYGRCHSQRGVNPDGSLRTKTGRRPRQEWPVVIPGHHEAYVTWETFLANEKRLASNDNRHGACPPREGSALLQGMVRCGSCGRVMATNYPFGNPVYDCTHARGDHAKTNACRSIRAQLVDGEVAKRVLAAISTEEIQLALAAADEVQAREATRSRALDLQVERARYEAGRAERAFHQCEPENRLVARTLERRWEEKLQALEEAEAAQAAARQGTIPLPARAELEALAENFHNLWAAPSTTCKDRKRILRALVADVTLISKPAPDDNIRIGIHWQSGATEEVFVDRPSKHGRACVEVSEALRKLMDRPAGEVAKVLAAKGLKTYRGRQFTARSVCWLRNTLGIPSPCMKLGPNERTVAEVATELGVTTNTVYTWIERKVIDARRAEDGRLCVSFTAGIREACITRVANSRHLRPGTQGHTIGDAI
jgi:DNA invertase Pin-like site-specific DNA recombinase